jgi:hypothetical protein
MQLPAEDIQYLPIGGSEHPMDCRCRRFEGKARLLFDLVLPGITTSIPEMRLQMAKLSTAARKALPTQSFAEPDKRKYPIENEEPAKNALSRVSQAGTTAEKAKVKAAVKKKYPSIGKNEK